MPEILSAATGVVQADSRVSSRPVWRVESGHQFAVGGACCGEVFVAFGELVLKVEVALFELRRETDPQMIGQQTRTPMPHTEFGRWWYQRSRHDLAMIELQWPARAWPIRQPHHPGFLIPGSPADHRRPRHP